MSTQIGQLLVRILADPSQFHSGMGQVEARTQATAGKVSAASSMMKVAMVGAFVGIGVAISKMAMQFETSMAKIATLMPQQRAEVDALKETIKKLAVQYGQSTEEIAAGAYQVVSAFGYTADAAKQLEIATRAATAGFTSTEQAINLLSLVSKGYGDTSVEMMEKISDLSFLTVKLGQTTFPELASSMAGVVPLAKALNVKIEELYAGFATLTGVTGNTAEVTTQLEGIMGAFIKTTEPMKKAIQDAGYASAEAMIAELGYRDALIAVRDTTDGSMESWGKLIRRKEALTAALALTSTAAGIFDVKLGKLVIGAGETTTALGIVQDTTEYKLKRAFESIKVTIVELGEAVLPVIADIASATVAAVESIKPLFDTVALLFKSIGDAFNALPNALKTVMGKEAAGGRPGEGYKGGFVGTQWGGMAPEKFLPVDHMRRFRKEMGISEEQAKKWAAATEEAAIKGKKLADEIEAATRKFPELDKAGVKAAGSIFQATLNTLKGWKEYGKAQTKAAKEAKKAKEEFDALAKTINENLRRALGMETEWADLVKAVGKVKMVLLDVLGMFEKQDKWFMADFLDFWQSKLPATIAAVWNTKIQPLLATWVPPDEMKESWQDVFVSGFESALHSIGDIWKSFVIGLGDVLADKLKEKLGSSFLGAIGGAIGGALIGSLFSWVGGLFGGGGDNKQWWEQYQRDAQKRADERNKKLNDAIAAFDNAVLEIARLGGAIFSLEKGIVSGIIARRRLKRELRPDIRALSGALGIGGYRFDPEREEMIGVDLMDMIKRFSGKGDLITKEEWKQLLAFARAQGASPEQIQMLESIVERLNVKAEMDIAQKMREQQLEASRQARNTLKRRLPELERLADEARKWLEAIYNGTQRIGDLLEHSRPMQSGGSVFTSGLAMLHAGERVLSRPEVAAARDGGSFQGGITIITELDGAEIARKVIGRLEDATRNRQTRMVSTSVRYRGYN